MVELYLDSFNDLLHGGKTANASTMNKDKLEIREDPNTNMVFIQNAKMKTLNSVEDALDTFNTGLKSRKTT
jgi:hypothetical protein